MKKRGESLSFSADMKIPISKRLLSCAAFVPPGSRVADVGCDHGYLGVYLLREGSASFVYAMDLRPEPLRRAKANAARFGTSGQTRFLLSDGLRSLGPGQADAVVCAGIGGDAIAKILDECPWSRDEDVIWILQPQSSGNDLRRYLGGRGFSIRRETLVEDGGFLYASMEVRYGGGRALSPGEQYASPALLQGEPELVRPYLDRVIRGAARAVEGIKQAKEPSARLRLTYYETALHELQEMREDYENRQRNPGGAL